MNVNQEIETHAYTAALVDGEGAVMIGKTKEKRMKIPRYSMRVVVDNRYLPVLEEMKSTYGGFIHPRKKQKGRAPYFRWIIASDKAMELIRCLIPYLRIKREQAEIAIEFQEGMQSPVGYIKRGRVPPKEVRRRERLYQKMKTLNERGITKSAWKLRLL